MGEISKCEHAYQVERKKGIFDNSVQLIWCPKCGDMKSPPPQKKAVEVPQ